jgi:Tfp pilus assembly protein PilF
MFSRVAAFLVFIAAVSTTPLYADARGDAKAQVAFGIDVAQKGLWREAIYRWEKAAEIDPSYAAAYNDLAIGYEQLGRFADARKAYEKALEAEPNNTFIRNNYDQFRENYDRLNRRRGGGGWRGNPFQRCCLAGSDARKIRRRGSRDRFARTLAQD